MTRDIEILLAAIDAGPWQMLLVLADACEESGDQRRAKGLRWLVEWKRHPEQNRQNWNWSLIGARYFVDKNKGKLVSPEYLPREMHLVQKQILKQGNILKHPSCSAAIWWAAEVVGEWLESREPSTETLLP